MFPVRDTTTRNPCARRSRHGVELDRQVDVGLLNLLSRLGLADTAGVEAAMAGVEEDRDVPIAARRREAHARTPGEQRRGRRQCRWCRRTRTPLGGQGRVGLLRGDPVLWEELEAPEIELLASCSCSTPPTTSTAMMAVKTTATRSNRGRCPGRRRPLGGRSERHWLVRHRPVFHGRLVTGWPSPVKHLGVPSLAPYRRARRRARGCAQRRPLRSAHTV